MKQYDKFNVRILSILSYIGPLFIIGKFSLEKDEENVKFHTAQGEILFYLMAILLFITFVVDFFINPFIEVIEVITLLAYIGISVAWIILILMGVFSAAKGEKSALPLIGRVANKAK